jgi:hypothetical protein
MGVSGGFGVAALFAIETCLPGIGLLAIGSGAYVSYKGLTGRAEVTFLLSNQEGYQIILFPNSSHAAVTSTTKSSADRNTSPTPLLTAGTTVARQNRKLPGLPSHLH